MIDKIDERVMDYSNGFQAGQKHQKSSPDTIKLFNKMEEKITEIIVQNKGQQKDIDYIKLNIDEVKENLNEFIKCSDDKFAPKWVADALKVVIGFIVIAVLGSVIRGSVL